MAKKGKIMYVPADIINELDDLKVEESISQLSEAWHKMAKYTAVGREAGRLYRFEWLKRRPKVIIK